MMAKNQRYSAGRRANTHIEKHASSARNNQSKLVLAAVFAVAAIVGTTAILSTRAASHVTTAEVESGVIVGNASVVSGVATASGQQAVKFGSTANPNPSPNPNPPNGQLLWSDAPASPVGMKFDNESNWPQNWFPAAYNLKYGGSAQIVADPVKGKAIEFFGKGGVHGDDGYNPYQRAEIVPAFRDVPGGGGSSLAIGKTYWFGFDFWVGPGVGISRNHSLVWQVKQDPDAGSPNVEFSLQRHQEGLHMLTAGGNDPLGPVPVERWTRFVIGIKITNGSDSWIEVYRDGQTLIPHKALSGGAVKGSPKWAYMKTGIYHGPQAWDLRTKMANFKIGTTKSSVE